MLFCMPEAQGVFYSGGFFSRNRWVQGNDGGERTDNRLPKHMRGTGAFFPIRNNQAPNISSIAKADGMLNMVTWDYDFTDNSGFYRVFVRITRGNALNNNSTAANAARRGVTGANPAQPGTSPTAGRTLPRLPVTR